MRLRHAVSALPLLALWVPASARQAASVSDRIDTAVRSVPGYGARPESPLAADGEFLRRVWLDLGGHPPVLEETRAFLADPDPRKRSRKIDDLLKSERFADFWARRFAEVFFGNYHDATLGAGCGPGGPLTGGARDRIVQEFIRWFALKLRRDRPYDEIVSDMIVARGSTQGDPALAYKLSLRRDAAYPLDFAGGVARHFLGLQFHCARCHCHPFDRWNTEDFYRLAAFAVRERVRLTGDEGNEPSDAEVRYAPEGEMACDHFSRDDGVTSHCVMEPVFPYGGKAGRDDDRMSVLARLLTDRANPQFSRALVNRVWAWLLGRGIVDPVDDFSPRRRPLSPQLLDLLAREFDASGRSLQALVRAICGSRAYQTSSAGTRPSWATARPSATRTPTGRSSTARSSSRGIDRPQSTFRASALCGEGGAFIHTGGQR